MSGKPLDITQRQVRALCEGARKSGCIAVIEIRNAVVKLVPEERAMPSLVTPAVDASPEDTLDAELAAFEAQHGDD